MTGSEEYLSFSQRNGFSEIPTQLELGQVSEKQRLLFYYAIHKDLGRNRRPGAHSRLNDKWSNLALDVHVRIFGLSPRVFSNRIDSTSSNIEAMLLSSEIGELFDLVEFILRHENSSYQLCRELSGVFEETKSAYRVVDRKILALGTSEQRTAIEHAINMATAAGADAPRQHLVLAGSALSSGNWADSVRESIHAVEAMAVRISPEERSLGKALSKVERTGHMNGRLKAAFEKLYAYTNDERGIRHSRLYEDIQVDEADALFMFGACASFISYLIARERLVASE